uniref:Uncharacterized protein n=1 Tax=Mycena chlorophos TaxID=658473 RepID=A0ABQ0M0K6_MYCCL|nr:predicted protein [Mycena chlorophos]
MFTFTRLATLSALAVSAFAVPLGAGVAAGVGAGVAESRHGVAVGAAAGLGAGVHARRGLGVDAGAAAGVGAAVDHHHVAVGAAADVGAAVHARRGLGVGAGVGAAAGAIVGDHGIAAGVVADAGAAVHLRRGLGVGAGAGVAAGAHLAPRMMDSLPCIIDSLTSQLKPVTDALLAINVNVDVNVDLVAKITPLTNQLISILGGAVVDISALVGLSTSTILLAADETVLTVDAVAQLIAPVYITVIDALDSVHGVAVDLNVEAEVEAVLVTVGPALSPILATADPLVGGLLAATAPLLSTVMGTAQTLGLSSVINLVGGILGSL